MPDAQVAEWMRKKIRRLPRTWMNVRVGGGALPKHDRSGGAAPTHRQRRAGGGRKRRELEQPKLAAVLEYIVDTGTRGDPMSLLRWTCKSTRTLADELSRQGYAVSASTACRLLRNMGYSLQANRKTIVDQVPDSASHE